MSEQGSPGHEKSDVSVTAAVWFGLAIAVGVALIALLIWKMETHLDPTGPAEPHSPNIVESPLPASGPVLQSNPVEELKMFQAEEDKALQSSAWIDRKAGIIRIPVDRAVALILERGLPTTGTTMPLPGPPTPPASQSPILPQGGTP